MCSLFIVRSTYDSDLQRAIRSIARLTSLLLSRIIIGIPSPTHFHSRLKSFLFCKSSLPQPFLFLLQDSLNGFPRLFTFTSEHIRLFTFYFFSSVFTLF